jgi:hypothetical protein
MECFPKPAYYDTFHSTAGRIFFNTGITSGKMPDLIDPGACTSPLGAIKFTGQNETNATCPLISNPRPAPIPCASKFDAESADQLSAAIVTASDYEWNGHRYTVRYKQEGKEIEKQLIALKLNHSNSCIRFSDVLKLVDLIGAE